MFKKTLFLAAVLSTLLACNSQAEVIHSTWVGGRWGLWEEPSNWNPTIVPDNNASNTYAVIIDGGTVELTANHSIDSLDTYDTYGKVNLKRWSLDPVVLTLSNSFTNHGELDTPNTAHLHIHGALINAAGAEIDICSEELRVYGPVAIQNSGRVHIDPDAEFKSEDSDVNNSGVLSMRGGVASAEETLINNTGGIIEGYGAVGGQQILNAGLIESIGGTLQLFGEAISNTGTLKNSPGASIRTRIGPSDQSNQGLIEVHSAGAVAFDCNLTNEPNGIIKVLGGTLAAAKITQKAGATLQGFGGITGNLVIDPNGLIKLTGPTNIVGNVNISKGATLEISDGTTLVTGHCTCTEGTIHMIGGAIILQGDFTNNNCRVIWEPGLYTNVADFNLDGKVNLEDFTYFADTWLWQTAWH
jgi:hypothetical protein